MVSAFPCYSRTYKELYNLYEEKFRSPKDFQDKNYKNLALIRMDLDVAFYKSAEKRIKWQKDKGLKSQYFKDETEFLEILSLLKQGKLDRELSVGSTEDDYYKYLKKLINSRLKYLNNDFHGAYYNVLKTSKNGSKSDFEQFEKSGTFRIYTFSATKI